jgi:hypothetical protein
MPPRYVLTTPQQRTPARSPRAGRFLERLPGPHPTRSSAPSPRRSPRRSSTNTTQGGLAPSPERPRRRANKPPSPAQHRLSTMSLHDTSFNVHDTRPSHKRPTSPLGSLLRVSSENGHLVRRAPLAPCDVEPLRDCGTYFRERAAPFRRWLCATASRGCGGLEPLLARDRQGRDAVMLRRPIGRVAPALSDGAAGCGRSNDASSVGRSGRRRKAPAGAGGRFRRSQR